MSANEQRADQPSRIAEKDLPRPPDASVVTDDADFFQQQAQASAPPADDKGKSSDGDPTTPAAAPDTKKPESPKDPKSATGDKKTDTDTGEQGKPKRSERGEYRFKKLSRQLAQETNRNKNLESQIATLSQTVNELQERIQSGDTKPAKKPVLKDFDSPEEYARAFAQYEATQRENKKPAKPAPSSGSRPAPDQPRETRQATQSEIKAFTDRGTKQFGDEFLDALETPMPVNQVMGEYMFDSDHGAALYLHLANNPKECREIYDSSPRRAEKLLDALAERAEKGDLDLPEEGQLKVEDDDKDKDSKGGKQQHGTGKKATAAPEPPAGGNDGGNYTPNKNLDSLDMDDYAAMRQKQEMAKRNRHIIS